MQKTDLNLKESPSISNKNLKLGIPKRSELKPVTDLMRIFHVVHNHIYANQGLSPVETFNEILKLLFLKIQDEISNDGEFVKFGITDDEYYRVMDGKTTKFRTRIDQLLKEAKINFKDVFNTEDSINLNESTLAFVVGQLQYFDLSKSNRDIKGIAFQKFIFSQHRRSRGQFLTPDPIIELTVKMTKPKKKDHILDPACGSASFLVEAMNYITKNELSKLNTKEKDEARKKFAKENLVGIEINPTMIKVSKMRMILENDGRSGIFRDDALNDLDDLLKSSMENTKNKLKKESFDLVLTNPPFGSQGKITNKSVLRRFSLGHSWKNGNELKQTNSLLHAQVPDILFLERCLDFLKDGGKLAIVLPVGDLENKSLEYVRKFIIKKSKILAIVSLPNDTFIPFGTGIKVCILFLQKMNENQLAKEKDYKIFFSIIKKIGYEGNKNGTINYKKNKNGEYLRDKNNNLIVDEDISAIIDAYDKFLKNKLNENDISFSRNFLEIVNRLDPEYYSPTFKQLQKKLKKKNAVPLKSVCKIISQRPEILKNKKEVVRYVEINNINQKLCELNSFTKMKVHELPSRASYEIKSGDILTAVSGISTGTPMHASAYVTDDFDGCICTNGLRVLRPTKIDPFYLISYLRSDYFLLQMLQLRTGAAIPAVNDAGFENLLVILPDKNNQKKIAEKIQKSFQFREDSKKMLDESHKILNEIFLT